MKRHAALFCLLLSLATPLFLSEGCKTPPTASQAAYATLDGVGATVDAAMKTAAQLRVAGKITSGQWADIASKHAIFLKAYAAAIDTAAVALDKASVPSEVAAMAGDLVNLIATFK